MDTGIEVVPMMQDAATHAKLSAEPNEAMMQNQHQLHRSWTWLHLF